MREPVGPLPRPPLPGPEGTTVRVATAADAKALVGLYVEALRGARLAHREEIVDWVVQAVLHDPLRGLYVLAEPKIPGAERFVGFAAFEASASATHGWSGRLAGLYVVPDFRRKGIGRWLLAESLEFARYFGLNHVVSGCPSEEGPLPRLLAWAGFEPRQESLFELDLPPLYDEG